MIARSLSPYIWRYAIIGLRHPFGRDLADLVKVGACKLTKLDLDPSCRCFGSPSHRKDFAYLDPLPPHKWNQSMATANGREVCCFCCLVNRCGFENNPKRY